MPSLRAVPPGHRRIPVRRGGTRGARPAEGRTAHALRRDRAHRRSHPVGLAVVDRRGRRRPRQADHHTADHRRSTAGNLDHPHDRRRCRRCRPCRPDARNARRDVQPFRHRAAAREIGCARCAGEADRGRARRRRTIRCWPAIRRTNGCRCSCSGNGAPSMSPSSKISSSRSRARLRRSHGGKDQEAILDGSARQRWQRSRGARETLYEQETGSLLNLLGSRDARLGVDADLSRSCRATQCRGRAHALPN